MSKRSLDVGKMVLKRSATELRGAQLFEIATEWEMTDSTGLMTLLRQVI